MKTYNCKYRHNRTAAGNFMYDIVSNAVDFIALHPWMFYLLSFTWGLIMTIIGLLTSLVMLCIGKKPHKVCFAWYFEISSSWGGCSIGTMFLRDKNSDETINYHELGHAIQNAILGPFWIFLVGIPSAVRYWIQTINMKTGKSNKPYDMIWFEGNATDIGTCVYLTYDYFK